MHDSYARDLDLNLLRVFVVVAEAGSVTQAAARLYLTQPAVSAALRRLQSAVGAALFARQGRGLVLTARGVQLQAAAKAHLTALVDAALAPARFDPRTSDRTLRIGLADTMEMSLLPPLLRRLGRVAPHLRLIVIPVQFRTIAHALAAQDIELAVTVADELPSTIERESLFRGGFVCLYDPRFAHVGRRFTERRYFDHDHVIVSYNGDLRGIIEDVTGKQRRVRCSVPSFNSVGAIVEGSSVLATIPELVARQIIHARPRLRATTLPITIPTSPIELLWPRATTDDPACAFLRATIREEAAKWRR